MKEYKSFLICKRFIRFSLLGIYSILNFNSVYSSVDKIRNNDDTLILLETNKNRAEIENNFIQFNRLRKISDHVNGLNIFCKCRNWNDSVTLYNALDKINYFRELAGLDSVNLVSKLNANAMEAAFLMHKNNKLSHYPDQSWKCFNEVRAFSARRSLLAFYKVGVYNSIEIFFKDNGKENFECGHRRWLLWGDLKNIGYSKTSKAEAVFIDISSDSLNKNSNLKFITYPTSGYFPHELIYERFTFSINSDSNLVDFSKVEIKANINGKVCRVNNIYTDYTYGDPSIIFEIDDLFIIKDNKKVYNPKFKGEIISIEIFNLNINNKINNIKYQIKPIL